MIVEGIRGEQELLKCRELPILQDSTSLLDFMDPVNVLINLEIFVIWSKLLSVEALLIPPRRWWSQLPMCSFSNHNWWPYLLSSRGLLLKVLLQSVSIRWKAIHNKTIINIKYEKVPHWISYVFLCK